MPKKPKGRPSNIFSIQNMECMSQPFGQLPTEIFKIWVFNIKKSLELEVTFFHEAPTNCLHEPDQMVKHIGFQNSHLQLECYQPLVALSF